MIGETRSINHSKLSLIAVYGAAMGCIGTGPQLNTSAIDNKLMAHTSPTRGREVLGDGTGVGGGKGTEW